MRTTRCSAGCGRSVPILDLAKPREAVRCGRCVRLGFLPVVVEAGRPYPKERTA